jgi:hypothetical protein
VFATPLANVLATDTHPLVLGRVDDHPLDQSSVRLLDVRAAGNFYLSLAKALGKPVPGPLELGDPEHSRSAGGGHGPVDPQSGEGRREELDELALEAGDLAPQLDPCRKQVRTRGGISKRNQIRRRAGRPACGRITP